MRKNFSLPLTLGLLLTSSALSSAAFAQNEFDELDEIITTGSPLSRTVNDTITGVSVLTGDELERRLAGTIGETLKFCLLYTSPSPRDQRGSRMPSSA